jgi:hypothetical protein
MTDGHYFEANTSLILLQIHIVVNQYVTYKTSRLMLIMPFTLLIGVGNKFYSSNHSTLFA